MQNGPLAAIDRKLADVLLAQARHDWPALKLVPRNVIRPVLLPTAERLRRSLTRAALVATSIALLTALALLA
jgi:hypothetical protein